MSGMLPSVNLVSTSYEACVVPADCPLFVSYCSCGRFHTRKFPAL